MARELGFPGSFSMNDFRLRLARYSARPVHIVPLELDSGSPSGFWFRRKGTDYLLYESRTSPFHQAHIVLHLAAHALLVDASDTGLDPGLLPTVNFEQARLTWLADMAPSQVSDAEADSFALFALTPAKRSMAGIRVRRSLRRLEPLRRELIAAVPQAARPAGQTTPPGVTYRLCQAVIEIRDAVLGLRSYRDPEVAAVAAEAGRTAGLAGSDLAASVEAAVLAHAIQAYQAGRAADVKSDDPDDSFVPQADLASEAAWLVKVSRAFGRR